LRNTKDEETRINFENNKELNNFNAYFSVASKEIAKMTKQNDSLQISKDRMVDVIGERKQGRFLIYLLSKNII
jgi:hypothetical protein